MAELLVNYVKVCIVFRACTGHTYHYCKQKNVGKAAPVKSKMEPAYISQLKASGLASIASFKFAFILCLTTFLFRSVIL